MPALVALGGCAPTAGPTPTPTKTRMPTARPATPAAAVALPLATAPAAVPIVVIPPTLPPAPTTTPQPVPTALPPTIPPTSTATPEASLTLTADSINARRGPGTNYEIAGSLTRGQPVKVTGKSEAGDWWQICCVSGDPAWVAASLVQVENAEAVALVANVPPPPPSATSRPALPPTQAPPPPAADPCANIGGDGCKWKVTGGPKTADNGGRELKLQLLFIHSGIDGGQPQGSYFIVLEKDGQRLPVPDSVRSLGLSANEGSLGRYNYEYVLQLGQLPGNRVAGNYTLWVLDGNGERDSRNLTFSIGENQGLLWIQFDQA